MTWAKQQGKTSKRPSHRDRLKAEAERVAEDHRRLKAGFLRREKQRKRRTMDHPGNTSPKA